MNEPLDSRPQQTVNRLRLLVAIPILVTAIGVFFLAVQLARHFRERQEPLASESPAKRPASAAGQTTPEVARSKARAGTPAATPPKPLAGTAVPKTPVTPVALIAPPVAVDSPLTLTPPAPAALTLHALPAHGIVGRVFLRGTPPVEREIPVDPSCGVARAGHPKLLTRFFSVGTNGGLGEVVVSLQNAPVRAVDPGVPPLEIRQRGCEYLPYVNAVQVGQTIRVFNDDRLLHNVHPTPVVDGNPESNRAQLAGAPPLDFSFPKPEPFLRFKCDVHPWMFAYVSVVAHPFFAVSTTDGQFALPEPPPGNYTLQLFHRKAGEKLVPVTVRPGKRLVIRVTLDISDPAKHEATVTEE